MDARCPVVVPSNRSTVGAIAGTLRTKAPGVTDKIEKVRFPERTVVKFHDDQAAVGRDLTDGRVPVQPPPHCVYDRLE